MKPKERKLVATIEFDTSQPIKALRELRREMHRTAGRDWRGDAMIAVVAVAVTLLAVHLFGPGPW